MFGITGQAALKLSVFSVGCQPGMSRITLSAKFFTLFWVSINNIKHKTTDRIRWSKTGK
jgi:hypothetical protein